ncbi:hypothetical protein C8R48DRAFT_668085 [Suillus tomentosus]|nr:hypothetical protein C8R48DRAFT_668085 [Suillus tomentosus]
MWSANERRLATMSNYNGMGTRENLDLESNNVWAEEIDIIQFRRYVHKHRRYVRINGNMMGICTDELNGHGMDGQRMSNGIEDAQLKHLCVSLQADRDISLYTEKKLDDQFNAFPRWCNLNHFDWVTNITYSDGNKLQDISKCIASYLHIDMYISLEVQTESTIAAGRAEVLEFQNCLEIHSVKHIFDNIMAKGAARNVSTQPNKKQHGPMKCWYPQQTNCKDITNQILELNHRSIVSEFICSRIECLDEEQCKLILSQEELEDMDEDDEPFEEHFHTNSPLKNHTTLAQLEEENKSICVFHQFRKKLATFLNHFLPSHNTPLPEGITWLRLSAQDKLLTTCGPMQVSMAKSSMTVL